MRGMIYLPISILVYASVQGAVINKQQAVANDTSPQEKDENQIEPQKNVHDDLNPTNQPNQINLDHNDNKNDTIYNIDIKSNKGGESLDSSSSAIEDKPHNEEKNHEGKDGEKHLPVHPENTHKLMTSRRGSRLKRNVENEEEETSQIESREFENVLPIKNYVVKVNEEVAKTDTCVDRDSNVCPILAHYGECDDNEDIRKNCKYSCKLCGDSKRYYVSKINDKVTEPDACVDIDSKFCGRLAKQGQCTTNNNFRKHCRLSCKVCGNGNTCVDEDDHLCPLFAEHGECARNDKIRNNCKFSCKVCGNDIDENCKDQHKSCLTWAAAGLCSDYPEFMSDKCKKSCKLCKSYSPFERIQEISLTGSNIAKVAKSDACVDVSDRYCPLFAEQGACVRNDNVRENCKFSCNLCDKVIDENCKDEDKSCSTWASDGLCSRFPEFMSEKCKKSCQLCKSYSPMEPIQ